MTTRAEARELAWVELLAQLTAARAVRDERSLRRRQAITALDVAEHEVHVLDTEWQRRLQQDGFLAEHARREALPRQVCPDCQFEYTDEQTHVCRSTRDGEPKNPGHRDA